MSCDPNITHEFILSHPEIFKKVKFTEAPKLEVGEILYYFYKKEPTKLICGYLTNYPDFYQEEYHFGIKTFNSLNSKVFSIDKDDECKIKHINDAIVFYRKVDYFPSRKGLVSLAEGINTEDNLARPNSHIPDYLFNEFIQKEVASYLPDSSLPSSSFPDKLCDPRITLDYIKKNRKQFDIINSRNVQVNQVLYMHPHITKYVVCVVCTDNNGNYLTFAPYSLRFVNENETSKNPAPLVLNYTPNYSEIKANKKTYIEGFSFEPNSKRSNIPLKVHHDELDGNFTFYVKKNPSIVPDIPEQNLSASSSPQKTGFFNRLKGFLPFSKKGGKTYIMKSKRTKKNEKRKTRKLKIKNSKK